MSRALLDGPSKALARIGVWKMAHNSIGVFMLPTRTLLEKQSKTLTAIGACKMDLASD